MEAAGDTSGMVCRGQVYVLYSEKHRGNVTDYRVFDTGEICRMILCASFVIFCK